MKVKIERRPDAAARDLEAAKAKAISRMKRADADTPSARNAIRSAPTIEAVAAAERNLRRSQSGMKINGKHH